MAEPDDAVKLARAYAKAKLGKDIADFGFRLVQMFFVQCLVFWVWKETGHWLGAVGTILVGGLLFLHIINAPNVLLIDFERAHGAVKNWHSVVMFFAFILFGSLVFLFLMVGDPIVNTINTLMHPGSVEPVTNGLH